ncbi:MAG: glycosyltransferase family 4 protein [Acidobacteriota bacterium]
MKLLVVSYKTCWLQPASPSGYATDGGFPFQMRALSELFDSTTLLIPCSGGNTRAGEGHLTGNNLSIVPLPAIAGADFWRKVRVPFWLMANSVTLLREILKADAVHAPIPGDVGTIGMMLALALGKPLFVRHCGNWNAPETAAEKFWRWFMEKFAGGRFVCLATGEQPGPPSQRNAALSWIFATTLTEQELSRCATNREAFPQKSPRLLIACRQERLKGTGVVIESLPLLQQEFPGIAFDVVGDGGALAEFRQLAAKLNLNDSVVFHGLVNHDRVIELMQQADLFCFPTTSSEGFPKAALEALACGLPAVTTKVSALPQLVGGGAGVLLDEATPQAVAAAVRQCLSDKDGYQQMSKRAFETARRYSLERWRDRIGQALTAAWGRLRSNEPTHV